MGAADSSAIWLTLKLASTTTFFLLVLSTPLAWWLSRTKSKIKQVVRTIVALPLVLPPTVIGFYLLVFMGPNGALGHLTQALGLGLLPFTFMGLVMASMLYSLPFVVQPLHHAFEAIGERPLEVAATCRASPLDTFFSVVLPLSKPGYINACVMGFAHTLGEFGVVLMIGGNIPGISRVVSVQIYDHVDSLEYADAHLLAATMLFFSFSALFLLYKFNSSQRSL